MKQIDKGILPESQIQFFSRSEIAKKLYYNILCKGHFFCDSNYHLVRECYDSILLVLLKNGNFTFRDSNGDYVTATKNSIVILDCYIPHEYYSEDSAEFLWMHIDGVNCRDFCSEIINANGNIIKDAKAGRLFLKIYDGLSEHSDVTESDVSYLVHHLLSVLLTPDVGQNAENRGKNVIRKAKEFIAEHLDEELTTQIISDALHISPTHLSRLFRQHTGFSPYDYVISERINKAKEYLLTTDKSITDIAYFTGFNSQSNFIYCFKNHERISPGRFRKLSF